jgi:NAD(P)H-dependent flavin oxidoreductase YrpB (nitropropane dioxygenase family)
MALNFADLFEHAVDAFGERTAVACGDRQPGAPEPLGMPLQNLLVSEAHQRLMRSGQPDVVPMPAGQIIGRMTEVRPVADVMATLILQTNEALDRLRGLR